MEDQEYAPAATEEDMPAALLTQQLQSEHLAIEAPGGVEVTGIDGRLQHAAGAHQQVLLSAGAETPRALAILVRLLVARRYVDSTDRPADLDLQFLDPVAARQLCLVEELDIADERSSFLEIARIALHQPADEL